MGPTINLRHCCVIARRTVTVTEEVCGALCAYNQPRLSSLIGAGRGYATAAVKTKLSSQKDDRPCPLNQPPHRLSALGCARPGTSLSSLECWGIRTSPLLPSVCHFIFESNSFFTRLNCSTSETDPALF